MPKRAQPLVAVFYEHPLLGEGIARILLVETDAEVAVAPAADSRALKAALARHPDVVIFEGRRCGTDWRRLARHAVLIDVTSAMTTPTDGCTAGTDLVEIMLAAVRAAAAPPLPGDTACPPSGRR